VNDVKGKVERDGIDPTRDTTLGKGVTGCHTRDVQERVEGKERGNKGASKKTLLRRSRKQYTRYRELQ
jgi:hypothetical protein